MGYLPPPLYRLAVEAQIPLETEAGGSSEQLRFEEPAVAGQVPWQVRE